MLEMGGRERNRVSFVTGEGGFQQRLLEAETDAQSPFGRSKFKRSALALKKHIWDLNGVAISKEG